MDGWVGLVKSGSHCSPENVEAVRWQCRPSAGRQTQPPVEIGLVLFGSLDIIVKLTAL